MRLVWVEIRLFRVVYVHFFKAIGPFVHCPLVRRRASYQTRGLERGVA